MLIAKAPLLLHMMIETAAARSFIMHPRTQLPLRPDGADRDKGASRAGRARARARARARDRDAGDRDAEEDEESDDDVGDVEEAEREEQARASRREADLILVNLGGALLATNLVALVILLRPDDEAFDGTGRLVSLALASYHVWPAHRALARIKAAAADMKPGRTKGPAQKTLGGPPVHLAVHIVCLLGLVCSGLFGGQG